jgi:drug/metabolite transporter (DMT)-like permease
MRSTDMARLVALAAIWGASYIFMRVAAPVFGAVMTTEIRVVLAAAVLYPWLRLRGGRLARHELPVYLLIGVTATALPFTLYAYAALSLPVAYMVVLNATSPLFGAVLTRVLLGEALTSGTAAGLLIGVMGVASLVGLGPLPLSLENVLALVAGTVAAACYALAGTLMHRHRTLDPTAVATGTSIGAALMLAPFALVASPAPVMTTEATVSVVLLGLLCTGVAYLLYFRLLANVGATRALTVTFLIPAFGMLWGALLLGEPITLTMIGGCALILVGVAFIVRPAARRARRRAPAR